MNDLSSEIYENSKLLVKEASQKKFLLKILVLFGLYLFSNYIFDRIDREDLITVIGNIVPYELDTHHLVSDQKTGFSTDNNKKEFYLNTYIHIVAETGFKLNGQTPFISEKTFRPIANLQPFLLFGNTHSLKLLQDLGFDIRFTLFDSFVINKFVSSSLLGSNARTSIV